MDPASKSVSNNWTVSPRNEDRETLFSKKLSILPLTAHLLIQRGIETVSAAEQFLNPQWESLPDPGQLPEIDRAVDRLLTAYQKREKVLFYGDYDVDGMTGTAQMVSFFRELGFPTEAYLPHRIEEGYGLNLESIQKILAQKRPDLLVTIDNGTNALAELTFLKQQGVDVIVIDHHETPHERPSVVALLNPKRKDSTFPPEICSAGLVFFLLIALRSELRKRGVSPLPNLRRYLDLVCLGTIADIVPLKGVNRLLVKEGLKELSQTERPGLKALIDRAEVRRPIQVGAVGFRLTPRLNAAGRIDHPELALQLLLATDPALAISLAEKLDLLNRRRQEIEEKVLREAIDQVERGGKREGIVVGGRGWHLGVVGIVASKLVDLYHRPTIVLSINQGVAKGSARTPAGFSLFDALTELQADLLKFGGHQAAAGLSLKEENLLPFAEHFNQLVSKRLSPQPELNLFDAPLPFHQITRQLVEELSLLAPHGPGNPEPTFLTEARFNQCRIVGQGHLKARLIQGEIQMEGIGFNQGPALEKLLAHTGNQIAFIPQLNQWNGTESIQLVIKKINL